MKIDSAGSMSERSENMSDLIEIINAIPHLYRGKGCTDEQLAAAQEALGMTFPPEYIAYVRAFGCIECNAHEWAGLGFSQHTGNEISGAFNVVNLTQREREINDDFPTKMLVLENACIDGILITVDEAGAVYQVQYETCRKLFDSISAYLDWCMLPDEE